MKKKTKPAQRNNRPRSDNKVLTAQVIRDDFKRFLSYMPNPDNIAAGTFESYQTYREMLDDPRIKSLVNTLKIKALNFPFRIVQGEGVTDEVYEFVINQPLFKNKFYAKMKRALTSLNYGFSNTEAVWDRSQGGKIRLIDNMRYDN